VYLKVKYRDLVTKPQDNNSPFRIKIKFNQPKLNPHALQDSFQNNLKIVLVHAQIMNGRATNTSSRGL